MPSHSVQHPALDTNLNLGRSEIRIVALDQRAMPLLDLFRTDKPTLRTVPRVEVA